MTETIDGRALVVAEPTTPPTLFGTDDPNAIIRGASERATALAAVIRKQKLASNIQGRDHVRVEGWTLLGSLLGVFPVTVWTHPTETGWEARVEARTLSGAVVGAAEAECSRDEGTWRNRPGYALRSMAQTRATSKALRMPLGFVMSLAGFDPAPAEEMEHDERVIEHHPQDAPRRAEEPGAPSNDEMTAYGRGLKRAADLGIDTKSFVPPTSVTRSELVALSKQLKVAIDGVVALRAETELIDGDFIAAGEPAAHEDILALNMECARKGIGDFVDACKAAGVEMDHEPTAGDVEKVRAWLDAQPEPAGAKR